MEPCFPGLDAKNGDAACRIVLYCVKHDRMLRGGFRSSRGGRGSGRKFIGGKTYEKIDRVGDRGCHAAGHDAHDGYGGNLQRGELLLLGV